jgi:hypothetical protein
MNNTKSVKYFSLYKMVTLHNQLSLNCSDNGRSVYLNCLSVSVLVRAPLPFNVVGEKAQAIIVREWRRIRVTTSPGKLTLPLSRRRFRRSTNIGREAKLAMKKKHIPKAGRLEMKLMVYDLIVFKINLTQQVIQIPISLSGWREKI